MSNCQASLLNVASGTCQLRFFFEATFPPVHKQNSTKLFCLQKKLFLRRSQHKNEQQAVVLKRERTPWQQALTSQKVGDSSVRFCYPRQKSRPGIASTATPPQHFLSNCNGIQHNVSQQRAMLARQKADQHRQRAVIFAQTPHGLISLLKKTLYKESNCQCYSAKWCCTHLTLSGVNSLSARTFGQTTGRRNCSSFAAPRCQPSISDLAIPQDAPRISEYTGFFFFFLSKIGQNRGKQDPRHGRIFHFWERPYFGQEK